VQQSGLIFWQLVAGEELNGNAYRQAAMAAGGDELVPKAELTTELLPDIWRVTQATDPGKGWPMQLCIRRQDRAGAVTDYRRLEETLWRELELLPGQRICLLYEMAMRGG
jgi:hypothetical protein